jgi:hypothetical protein
VKVHPGFKITDSKDIKMIWSRVKKDALTCFQITIEKSNDKKIIKAREQTAPHLTNILSSITGIEITDKDPPTNQNHRKWKDLYSRGEDIRIQLAPSY